MKIINTELNYIEKYSNFYNTNDIHTAEKNNVVKNTEMLNSTSVHNAKGVSLEISVEGMNKVATLSADDTNRMYMSQLSAMKLYSGPIDGNITRSNCVQAIKNFQSLYGCAVTGYMDGSTSAKMSQVYLHYTNALNDIENSGIASTLYLDADQKKYMALTWTYLKDGMGLSSIHAAAAMGNMFAESGIIPNNANDNYYPGEYNTDYIFSASDEIAYGIMQWKHLDRKPILATKSDEMGLPESNINVQFATIAYEARNAYSNQWSHFRSSTTINSATQVFMNEIEEPNDNSLSTRINYAQIIYNALN